MATDYVLFIHGVNTRPKNDKKPNFAGKLMELIQECQDKLTAPPNELKMKSLDWYEVMLSAENNLLESFQQSRDWDKFWFKDFRKAVILPFAGDAVLYTSRYIGSEVVRKLKNQAEILFDNHYNPEQDRLHLVTHSWGTVILFDILFAGRWDDTEIPGSQDVRDIRNMLFGVKPNPTNGIRIASIHTMGSPLALINLMNIKGVEKQKYPDSPPQFTHDITKNLRGLLENLYNACQQPLFWKNYAHPGDPIAYPLVPVLPNLLDGQSKFLHIEDKIVSGSGWSQLAAQLVSDTPLALLINGLSAHDSYWYSPQVAEEIFKTIQQAPSSKESQVSRPLATAGNFNR
ncbi:hypothetical protein [Kamptonema formosum]|uniref:hypothetical protein n=1 Tax=Kamptonema formosum TaxID=331992 RepID=UPI000349E127|nr:hypothetical protein [Oscillatoria sp. PCC 10802]